MLAETGFGLSGLPTPHQNPQNGPNHAFPVGNRVWKRGLFSRQMGNFERAAANGFPAYGGPKTRRGHLRYDGTWCRVTGAGVSTAVPLWGRGLLHNPATLPWRFLGQTMARNRPNFAPE